MFLFDLRSCLRRVTFPLGCAECKVHFWSWVGVLCLQFALGPSSFSCSDVSDGEEGERASRGVRILYHFPWGAEPVETLWNLGDMELLEAHKGSRAKLQVSHH